MRHPVLVALSEMLQISAAFAQRVAAFDWAIVREPRCHLCSTRTQARRPPRPAVIFRVLSAAYAAVFPFGLPEMVQASIPISRKFFAFCFRIRNIQNSSLWRIRCP